MTEVDVPESHPRYESLVTRHRIEAGVEAGITSQQGLIAQGRGEAFDYLLGERTLESANEAARVAAVHLLRADHPVLSVNGNVAALVPDDIIDLAEVTGADIEVNLFNRSEARMQAIVDHLRDHGAPAVKGLTGDGTIPGLDHERGTVDADGIGAADVVLVPLEDGDRVGALTEMGARTIVIDLNPLSRSAAAATVPVVDNVIRAVPNITAHVRDLQGHSPEELDAVIQDFTLENALADAERAIREGVTKGLREKG